MVALGRVGPAVEEIAEVEAGVGLTSAVGVAELCEKCRLPKVPCRLGGGGLGVANDIETDSWGIFCPVKCGGRSGHLGPFRFLRPRIN